MLQSYIGCKQKRRYKTKVKISKKCSRVLLLVRIFQNKLSYHKSLGKGVTIKNKKNEKKEKMNKME